MRRVSEVARLYHAHHSQNPEDIPFWLELAEGKGSFVLELGCGSGRVSQALAKAGQLVYGLDNDPEMLTFFKSQTEYEFRDRIHLLQADLTRFHLNIKFPLIIIPCNTYSTLSPDERQSGLRCVVQHLQPGGLLVASLPNPVALSESPRKGKPEIEAYFAHPLDGEPVQVSSSWQRTREQVTIKWDYDHLLPDGLVERNSMQIRQVITPVEVYLEELQQANFQIAFLYGDYNYASYVPESPQFIFGATYLRG